MEPHELHQAITSFGYNLSPQALGTLVRRYSTDGKIGFDDFVSCCIRLRTLTGKGGTHQGVVMEHDRRTYVPVRGYCGGGLGKGGVVYV